MTLKVRIKSLNHDSESVFINGGYKCITDKSSKGLLLGLNEHFYPNFHFEPSNAPFPIDKQMDCCPAQELSCIVESQEENELLVVVHSFPFATCSEGLKGKLKDSFDCALRLGARPSWVAGLPPPPINSYYEGIETISIVELIGDNYFRHNPLDNLLPETVLGFGCLGIIRWDQLYNHLLFIVGKNVKYGA